VKEICDFCNSIFVVLIVLKSSVLGDIINEVRKYVVFVTLFDHFNKHMLTFNIM
jgi:hypothetical protein